MARVSQVSPSIAGPSSARVFGLSSPGPFASFDFATSSWRTISPGRASAGTARRSVEFSETWPKLGLTRGGHAYRLESSGHPVRHAGSGPWPTPNAKVSNFGERPQTWYARRRRLKKKGYNGNGAGMPLAIAVQVGPRWRENPTAADAAAQARAPGGRLNPTWVEWLMGFPLGWTALASGAVG